MQVLKSHEVEEKWCRWKVVYCYIFIYHFALKLPVTIHTRTKLFFKGVGGEHRLPLRSRQPQDCGVRPSLAFWVKTIGFDRRVRTQDLSFKSTKPFSSEHHHPVADPGGGGPNRPRPPFFRPIFVVFFADFCYFRARHRGIWIPAPPPPGFHRSSIRL